MPTTMATMNAVKTAPMKRTRIQSPSVLARKSSNPTWRIIPSTAAVIPLASSHGTKAARKNTKKMDPIAAPSTIAADRTSNSRTISPVSRVDSRVRGDNARCAFFFRFERATFAA